MSPPADDNNRTRGCTYDEDATLELLGDSCRDFARVVLGAFDLVRRGVVTVMDYAERELCGPARDKYNAHAALLANAERLNKLLEEEEKRKKNKLNPFNRKAASARSLPTATTGARQTCDTGLVCIESDDVERSSSFFGKLFRKDKRTTAEDASGPTLSVTSAGATHRSSTSVVDVSRPSVRAARRSSGSRRAQSLPSCSTTRIRASPTGWATCAMPSVAWKMSPGPRRARTSVSLIR